MFALDEVMDQQLATKTDLARLERELKSDIVPMQRDLYVIKWMMGMVLAGIMAIILKTYFPA
ncbi:MAG: hypothetical protein ABL951_09475 [Alphaproteobacteria bacterium]